MEGKNTYIVRCGEVALKGMNKPYFERMLAERIKKVLKKYEGCEVKRSDGLLLVYAPEKLPREQVMGEISRVFGVDSISPAVEVESGVAAGSLAREVLSHLRFLRTSRGFGDISKR